MPQLKIKRLRGQRDLQMIMLAKIILLLIFGLFGVLFVAFLRLLIQDCDAVEVELGEVESWDSEAP